MASLGSLKSAIFEKEERKMQYQSHIRGLNAYDRHKKFMNDYVDFYGKEKNAHDALPIKTDKDTIREGYRFILSEEDDVDSTWEKRLVKRYYDKLFKEYCIADMSQYKKGKIGLRWRTEKEVISGKGQFVCGNKLCSEKEDLGSYEMQQVGEETDKMSVWKKSRDMSNVDVAEAIRTYEEYLLKEPEDQRNLRVVKDRVFHLVMGDDGHGYCRTYGSSVPRNLVYPQSSTTYESSNNLVQQITESLTKYFDEKFERIEARLNIFEKRLNILENKERNNNGQVNFSYFEAGENKQALVKLVACKRCAEKLVYKKQKEKEQLEKREKDKHKRKREIGHDDGEEDEFGSTDKRRKGPASTSGARSEDDDKFDEFLEGMFP